MVFILNFFTMMNARYKLSSTFEILMQIWTLNDLLRRIKLKKYEVFLKDACSAGVPFGLFEIVCLFHM